MKRDLYPPVVKCVSHVVSKGNYPRRLHGRVWSGAGGVLTAGNRSAAISQPDRKFCYYTDWKHVPHRVQCNDRVQCV